MPHSRSCRVEVVEGDITAVVADAIVNAAKSELRPGGGACTKKAEALCLQIKLVALDTRIADCLRAFLEARRSANESSARDG
ncbi:MAG: hypothetical protein ACTSX8_08080 [Alphaproteobacteria bacterium]